MTTSFGNKKALRFVITLSTGKFGSSNNDRITLQGFRPVQPRSFKGGVDVASVMAQIAHSMGFAFENNGVNVKLSDVYLANTDLEQAAGIGLWIDDKVLAITQTPTTPRDGYAAYLARFWPGRLSHIRRLWRQCPLALQSCCAIWRSCEGGNGRTASGRGMGCRVCRPSP